MSFDAQLEPKDPVSVLFTGAGSVDNVYRYLTGPCTPNTSCTTTPRFQDDRGPAANGDYECSAGVQWVLMGNVGGPLEWRPSTRAVMKASDRCLSGNRDHMRIFGAPANDVFGAWSVGTPHHERWTGITHLVGSWTAARDAFTQPSTSGFSPSGTLPEGVSYRDLFSWNNGGVFQNVPFDGVGVAIELK